MPTSVTMVTWESGVTTSVTMGVGVPTSVTAETWESGGGGVPTSVTVRHGSRGCRYQVELRDQQILVSLELIQEWFIFRVFLLQN